MNALKRFRGTRSQRRDKGYIVTAIKCTCLAHAIVLHRLYGIGKHRYTKIFGQVFELMNDYIDNYGSDCIEASLVVKARDEVDVEIEL